MEERKGNKGEEQRGETNRKNEEGIGKIRIREGEREGYADKKEK